MKRSGKSLICLLCVLALSRMTGAVSNEANDAPAHSAESDNPYSAIWLRNVFDLKPAPPPPPAAEPTNAPPPGVKLIGLADYAHVKMAMFTVTRQPEPGKPSPNLESSVMLREGERRDIGSTGSGLEVVEIDLPGKKAMIKLQGVLSPINLETNKPTGTAPGGRMAGGRGNPPGGVNPAGAAYSNGAPPPNASRQNRVPGNPNAQYSPQSTQNGVQPTYLNGGYNGATATPGLSLPGSSTAGTGAAVNDPSQQSVPAEVTAAILAAQQAAMRNAGKNFPPLPPGFDVSEPTPDAPNVTPPSSPPSAPPLGTTFHGKLPPGVP